MTKNLTGKKIAILVTNGFEQVELTDPKAALEKAGAKVDIISPEKDKVKGWKHTEWGDEFKVDVLLDDADPTQYDALLLPGGVINPDKLRLNDEAINFVKRMNQANKPIAAICHGPWLLINAGIVKDRKLTSWPSIKLDLINAGAKWHDAEVIRDLNLVTSRKPEDIPAFNEEIINVFSEELIPS
ncbi:MAG: type 1 glutamine amidotransferase [Gammaproteobacteria bacterium]|nr:type 1 glutamine amidotransferase [Gammaproteobacteria bacterium]